MAVTVNITGGMEYQFEVTATTVAEGAKEMTDKMLPEYGQSHFMYRTVDPPGIIESSSLRQK